MESYKCSYTELVSIKELKPHPKNVKKHPKEQIKRIAKLIAYQGQRSPIVVSKLSGFIVAGHCRLDALKLLKWRNAAVDYQDFENEDQEYAHLVADNASSEWAEIDLSLVNLELENLHLPDIELLGLKGFKIDLNESEDKPKQNKPKETQCPNCGEVFNA